MILKYFNSNEASEFGVALADQFAARGGSRTDAGIQEILARADREVRPLRLNFYKKAKFANTFKWRLLEKGIEPQTANEVTQALIVHLAHPAAGSAAPSLPAGQQDSGKLSDLISRAGKLLAAGNYSEAAALYGEIIALVPENPDALNNLGVALLNLGRYEESEQCYRQAIAIKPDFAGALCNLADLVQGNPLEAEEYLRRALKVNPKNIDVRVKLGMTLAYSGREHEARTYFKKVLKTSPNHPEALLGLGRIAHAERRFDEAAAFVRRALKAKPKLPGAWAALQNMRMIAAADNDWLKTAEEIAGSGISLWEESGLRFAMGSYCDEAGNFDAAFQNYQRANQLLKPVAEKYDRKVHGDLADDMIRGHSRQALAALGNGGSDSSKPIFVVGMPLAGVSQTEQIIAAHPAAGGLGESQFWLNAAGQHQSTLRRGILEASIRKDLGEEYLHLLARRCPDASRVVDGTPFNSDHLGMIHSVFPNARIVHMRRDPIDTGLSIYMQNFSTALRFSMDLSDIADYYRIHQRMMNHWRTVLPPGTILEVPYEQLLAEREVWVRKILDFVGLDWDPRCLSFHDGPVGAKALLRWHKYEKFIGPLKGLKD